MKLTNSRYFRVFMRILFSHIGLCVVVITYSVLGALLFLHLEGDRDLESISSANDDACRIELERDALIERVQRILDDLNSFDENTLVGWMDEYHYNLTVARLVSNDFKGVCLDELPLRWTMASAVLFTVTTIAGIGYGNIYPTTPVSQMALVCYALIGIPLTLMFLADIGRMFANFARVMFSRGLCFLYWRKREQNLKLYGTLECDEETMEKSLTLAPSRRKLTVSKTKQAEKERLQLMSVPITYIFGILTLYTIIGIALFAWSENWTYIQSAYFNVVTLLTIGLGDLVPGWDSHDTDMGKVKMCLDTFYIMTGLGLLAMALDLIVDEMRNASRKAGKKIGLVKEIEDLPEKQEAIPA